jgi:hypothetical protein
LVRAVAVRARGLSASRPVLLRVPAVLRGTRCGMPLVSWFAPGGIGIYFGGAHDAQGDPATPLRCVVAMKQASLNVFVQPSRGRSTAMVPGPRAPQAAKGTSSPSLGIFPKILEKRKVGVNFPSKMPFPVKAFNIRDLTYGVTQQYKYKRKSKSKTKSNFLAFCPGRSTK